MSWSELRQTVNMSLSDEDLKTLCFDLNVEYDDLPAQGKEGKVRELIAKMRREGHIEHLMAHLNNIRPNIPWDEIQLDIDIYSDTDRAFDQLSSGLKNEVRDELVVENGLVDEDEFGDEDEGLLDKFVVIEESGNKLPLLMNRTGELATEMTEKMNIATMQLGNSKGDTRKTKVIAIRLAGELRDFSIEIDSITVEMTDIWNLFYGNLSLLFSLSQDKLISLDNQITLLQGGPSLVNTLRSTSENIVGLQNSLGTAREGIGALRGVTKTLNIAVRKTDRAFSNYQDVLGQIITDSQGLIDAIEENMNFVRSKGYSIDEEE